MKQAQRNLKAKALEQLQRQAATLLQQQQQPLSIQVKPAFLIQHSSQQEQPQREQAKQQKEQPSKPQEKKKKKKKKKKEKQEKEGLDQQELGRKQSEIKELQQLVEHINKKHQSATQHRLQQQHTLQKWELSINLSKLNYRKEFEKKFPEAVKEQPEAKRTNQKMKSYSLVPVRTYRRQFLAGLDLERNQKQGYQLCHFKPTKTYSAKQQKFNQISNVGDIDLLFEFLRGNPGHIGCNYVLAEFFGLQGRFKESNQFLQNTLILYEECSPFLARTLFQKAGQVPIYLDSQQHYNQTLFKALFRMADSCLRRGTIISALQYHKLLLKLNPLDDPMGMLLCIDFSMISARDFKYFNEFLKNFSPLREESSLRLAPNFSYSQALVQFLLDDSQQSESLIRQVDISKFINFQIRDLELALELSSQSISVSSVLLRALALYPGLFRPILANNDLLKKNPNHSKFQGWQTKSFQQIQAHQFFTELVVPNHCFLNIQSKQDEAGMTKILEIYAQRTKGLWKTPQVAIWLKAAAGFLLNNLQFAQDRLTSFLQINAELQRLKLPYRPRKYLHLNKGMFSDKSERLQIQNIEQNPVEPRQPLPAGFRVLDREAGAIRQFFESLLPWVVMQEHPQDMQ